ncbi:MAG: hypothetical protein ABIH34_07080 [Nanoarchaeota archaeon]
MTISEHLSEIKRQLRTGDYTAIEAIISHASQDETDPSILAPLITARSVARQRQGDFIGAREDIDTVLKLRKKDDGSISLNTALVYVNAVELELDWAQESQATIDEHINEAQTFLEELQSLLKPSESIYGKYFEIGRSPLGIHPGFLKVENERLQGKLHALQGHYDAALAKYDLAESMLEDRPYPDVKINERLLGKISYSKARTLLTRGEQTDNKQDFLQAYALLHKSITHFSESGCEDDVAKGIMLMGEVKDASGDYEAAIAELKKIDVDYSPRLQAYTELNLASALFTVAGTTPNNLPTETSPPVLNDAGEALYSFSVAASALLGHDTKRIRPLVWNVQDAYLSNSKRMRVLALDDEGSVLTELFK